MNIIGRRQATRYSFLALIMVLLVAGVGLTSCGKEEAAFPSQPVTIISGWLGGTEQFLKAIAPEAEKALGVPVEIVNKVGNEGLDAIREFKNAPSDGYTLLAILDFDASAFAQGLIDVNPAEDEIPILIGNIAITQIYIRPNDQRYSDWDELVDYARQHPGLKAATIGTPLALENLSLAGLEDSFGVRFQQIPFDQAPERNASFLRGETDLLIDQPGDVKEFLDAGEYKAALTLWRERVKGFEDVPTAKERGADFAPLLRLRGLALPKGTPPDRVAKLKASFQGAFRSQGFQEFLRERMLDLVPYPEDPVAAMREQVELYQRLYEAMSITFMESEVGQEFSATLESNPSTGYKWQLAKPLDESILMLVGSEYKAPTPKPGEPPLVGAGGQEVWTFRAVGPGTTTVSLQYVRPWEKDSQPAKEQRFIIAVK